MYLFSRAFRLAGITALLALPGMAMAQATIPNYEFSSAAVDYPAGGGQNYSLQGTLGQTFATVDPPTNAGQNLVYGGFGETAVPFLYKGTVALGDFNGVISSIPITFHLFNNIDHKISDEQTGFAEISPGRTVADAEAIAHSCPLVSYVTPVS